MKTATEDTAAAPVSHYGRKQAGRGGHPAGLRHIARHPAPRQRLRPGQRSDLEGGVVAVFTKRVLSGQGMTVHGDGLQSRDFVHVADVVRAIEAALVCSEDVTWNVASGVSTMVLQLVSLLREVTESSIDVSFAEPRAGDVRHSLLSARRLMATGWGPPRELRDGLRQLVELHRDGVANGELALKLLRSTSRIIRRGE